MLTQGVGGAVNAVVSAVSSVVSGVVTFFMALIFSIYLLLGKEKLGGQLKRIMEKYLKRTSMEKSVMWRGRRRMLPQIHCRAVYGGGDPGYIVYAGHAADPSALCHNDWGADRLYSPDSGGWRLYRGLCGSLMILTVSPVKALISWRYRGSPAAGGESHLSEGGGIFSGASGYLGAGGRHRGRRRIGHPGHAAGCPALRGFVPPYPK